MAALHTWTGLLPGWLLYAVFLFGTTAYFQQEISRWMRPEMSGPLSLARVLPAADALLRQRAGGAREWTVSLPVRSGQVVRVTWAGGHGSAADGKVTLDPATGREISVRDTQGGSFLYGFHYNLYAMPRLWARIAVCAAAMAMLVAILSGVVTHKKIFADFFTLRFNKGQRSWLDSHNVTAVLALPFHLMITYTGLAALLFTLMPWAIFANFADQSTFHDTAYPDPPALPASGEVRPVMPLQPLVHRAQAVWASQGWSGSVGGVTITNPGDANAAAAIRAGRDHLGAPVSPLILSASDGRLLYSAPQESGARGVQSVMILLHLGTLADTYLRWLYFASSVMGTAMIATGLVLWTVKRRARLPDPDHPPFGFRLVERLNIGMMLGPMAGMAVYFLANRLLPLELARRDEREIACLFAAWGAVITWAFLRPAPRAWIEMLAVCALLYGLVPMVNALTTTRGLARSLAAGQWVYAGFDLIMLAAAIALGFGAGRLATRRQRALPRRSRGAKAETA
ncbi:PepSY-associated TM helix domain-containing protein [Novosphingobium resinovorum]|nr:PepSY-associated TM helix domain-containing protein [Novosphingobium resinovorum]